MLIPKNRSAKNMGKIYNNELVGFKMLALGQLYSICNICFLRGAANLRSAPGGRHSSYVTDAYAIKNIFIEHRSTGIPVPVPEQHFCSGSGEHF